MNEPKPAPNAVAQFRKLLLLLEANQKYLRSVPVEEDLLTAYKDLLHYLRARPPEKMAEIIGLKKGPTAHSKITVPRFNEEQIHTMTGGQIKELVSNPDIPRKDLEMLASTRFGVTRGGLSNLRTRDALVQKLLTLIGHESTHESIARAVDAASAAKQESGETRGSTN